MSEDYTEIKQDTNAIIETTSLRNIIIYFVVTLIWTWSWLLPNVLKSQGFISYPDWLGGIFSGLGIFGPTIVAIVIVAITEGKVALKKLLKKLIKVDFNKMWLLVIFFLPIIISGIAFGVSILSFGYTLEDNYYNIGFIIGAVIIGFFVGGPLAEELGWRGYALERLQKRMNAVSASLILGFVWAIWHLPLHFISTTTQFFIPIWAFFSLTIVLSYIYTWIYNNTNGSVLTAILLHWVFNSTAALLPFWQVGLINGQLPDNLLLPTYGMLIGFGLNLIIVIFILVYYKPENFIKKRYQKEESC